MEHIPVKNQTFYTDFKVKTDKIAKDDGTSSDITYTSSFLKHSSLCAAHTATDLVDSWRFSHETSESTQNFTDFTSPIESTLGYKASLKQESYLKNLRVNLALLLMANKERPYEMNLPDGIINYIRKMGRCSARYFNFDNVNDENFVLQADAILEAIQNRKSSSISEIAQNLSCKLQPIFPSLPAIEELASILANKNSILDIYYKIYSKACPEREKVDLPQIKQVKLKDEAQLKSLLVEQFDKTQDIPQPVIVNYCGRLASAGNSYGGFMGLGLVKIPRKDCAPHSSLIIGRRYNSEKGRCEVLLRNDTGTSLYSSRYHGDFDVDGKRPIKTFYAYKAGEKYQLPMTQDYDGVEAEIKRYREQGDSVYDFDSQYEFTSKGNFWLPMEALVKNSFYFNHWDLSTAPKSTSKKENN